MRTTRDLDALSPSLKAALESACSATRAPLGLALSSMLGAAAAICQDHFNVKRPTGQTSPCSLFLLTIAESGERKTTVDNLFLQPLRRLEQGREGLAAVMRVDYEAELEIWKKTKAAALRSVLKAHALPPASVNAARQEYLTVMRRKPLPPQSGRIIFSDATLEATLEGLSQSDVGIAISMSEGAIFFNSRSSQQLPYLNVLWDGGDLTVDRASKPSMVLRDRRATFSAMSQPGVFRAFIDRKNGQARDMGFLARALCSFPESTQGKRYIHPGEMEGIKDLNIYNQRIYNIAIIEGRRQLVEFEHSAAKAWVAFANDVEDKVRPGGDYSEVKDFGSKLADNVARVACILAAISDKIPSYIIQLRHVTAAIQICNWYAAEFLRLFGEKEEVSEGFSYGQILKDYLEAPIPAEFATWDWVITSKILTFGPSKLRKARNLNLALAYLQGTGEVEIEKVYGKRCVRLL